MAVRYEHSVTVRTSPEAAFALIDDLPATATWLPPCVSLEKVGPGPNAPGDSLRYVFREGGRRKEMAGEIVERIAGERLHCRYHDDAFDVTVDMRVAPAPEGTLVTQMIEIAPKTLLGRLLQPLIRLGLRKQTRDAAANLSRLLEDQHPRRTPG